MQLSSRVELNDGRNMPYLGLGTYQAGFNGKIERAVAHALEVGYRSIDTAEMYKNEKRVGAGIKKGGMPRDDVFVTSKVWPSHFDYDRTIKSCKKSLERLELDFLDLYLIHWPGSDHMEAWKALIDLRKQGLVKSIGVSNFSSQQLNNMIDQSGVVPTVNQVEFHPFNFKSELLDYCRSKNIFLEAYTPLTRGRKFKHPTIQELSEAYGKSPAQVLIRWVLQHDIVVIPKSTNPNRIEENANVFDFEISDEDMKKLNELDQGSSFI